MGKKKDKEKKLKKKAKKLAELEAVLAPAVVAEKPAKETGVDKKRKLSLKFEPGNSEYLDLIIKADRTATSKTAYINRLISEDRKRREATAKKALESLL